MVLCWPFGRTVVSRTSAETAAPAGVIVVTTVRPRASVVVRVAPSETPDQTTELPKASVVVSMLPDDARLAEESPESEEPRLPPLLLLLPPRDVWPIAGAEVMMVPPLPT